MEGTSKNNVSSGCGLLSQVLLKLFVNMDPPGPKTRGLQSSERPCLAYNATSHHTLPLLKF